ncbi:hypothetical protein ES705_45153 [subsurface metagenome]
MMEGKIKYSVDVRYKGGGEGTYYDTKIISCKDGILELMISSSKTICIVINGLSWWTITKSRR